MEVGFFNVSAFARARAGGGNGDLIAFLGCAVNPGRLVLLRGSPLRLGLLVEVSRR